MKDRYPVILYPTEGSASIFNPQRGGKNKKKGQSELIALARFSKFGCKEIREDVSVKIDGHNYESDFAYIDEEKGVYIDIEVDEPYSASGHPTHYMMDDGTNKDSARNKRFQDAGWYVVRFSEEQIFCHTKECLRTIYEIVIEAGVITEMPEALVDASTLQSHDRWTKSDSYSMKRRHHRKSYLGYDPSNMDLKGYMCCTRLFLPILWQSLWSKKVRQEMFHRLRVFFFK